MDFTLNQYDELLKSLIAVGYSFQTFEKYIENPISKVVILRHDVDRLPLNSLKIAQIESFHGIRSSFYFRILPGIYKTDIIIKIAHLGHEIGYHYEDLGTTAQNSFAKASVVKGEKGTTVEEELVNLAIKSFSRNLEMLRKLFIISTICMHGSPMSRWDNRLLWKYYDYHDFGIVGEPYFDINFDEVLYLTDTGRRWDGELVSVRDKASGIGRQASGENPYIDWKVKPFRYRTDVNQNNIPPSRSTASAGAESPLRFDLPLSLSKMHSTSDLINAAQEGRLPDQIMMTFHPQRWTDKLLPWVKELVWQNVKNVGKYFLVKTR